MPKTPKDPRSTQRKRARKVLFRLGVPYVCGSPNFTDEDSFKSEDGCGRSPLVLPQDAPKNLELAPVEFRVVGFSLQANHINKDIMDNDPVNLEWLCPSCHKLKDSKTEVGVSILGDDEHGYFV